MDDDVLTEMREAIGRLITLASLVTVEQVIKAGDEAINAAGLDPWCMNEGTATGKEKISLSFARHLLEGDDE